MPDPHSRMARLQLDIAILLGLRLALERHIMQMRRTHARS